MTPEDPVTIRNKDADWLFDQLRTAVRCIERIAVAVEKIAAASSTAPAPAIDLDTADADREVKKNPKKWKGVSFVGKKYSECPSDYLDHLGAALEFKAEMEEKEPERQKYARGTRLDASYARAWAKRKREANTGFYAANPLPQLED